uniref:Uncharacterized protein n=1 Tax=Nelumbo nucifera TaxID=4432 RepID=A0A822ZV10_NELNU|nr:TPA_asm: hypothetical protein HUJ06_003958 [Nelumbo nucifera]
MSVKPFAQPISIMQSSSSLHFLHRVSCLLYDGLGTKVEFCLVATSI